MDHTTLCTHLLTGAPGSGKTAIAAHMAKQSDFPFLKICAPKSMIGYHEAAKVQAIKKVVTLALHVYLGVVVSMFSLHYKLWPICFIICSIEISEKLTC